MGKYFGTDGVRGLANEVLTPELALNLGIAAGRILAKDNVKTIIIGRDTRRSGMMLSSALAAGATAAGLDVLDVGVATTPCVAFLSKTLECCGAMISASHNPAPDNGIKFFDKGFKLTDETELEIEKLLDLGVTIDFQRPVADKIGKITVYDEGKEKYLEYLKQCMNVDLSGLKIVVDCANGAASDLGPKAMRATGAQIISINDLPDGDNINLGCGSTHLECLSENVIKYSADFGLAYDGDADRLLAVDHEGNLVDGDKIMVILGLDFKKKGKEINDCVVSVMSNIGLKKAFLNAGINVPMTKVGDRYILEKMIEINAPIGGEQSGHIILLNLATTGDGILTGLALSSVVKDNNKSLKELATEMTTYPQVLINAKVKTKEGWDTNPKIKECADYVNEQLAGDGRLLLRPSGTEPLIRVMVEGSDIEVLNTLAQKLADVIISELG